MTIKISFSDGRYSMLPTMKAWADYSEQERRQNAIVQINDATWRAYQNHLDADSAWGTLIRLLDSQAAGEVA